MVDTVQPRVLASFRIRFGVVATNNEDATAAMEPSKTKNHRARHKTRASLISDKGLDAANHHRASGGGRKMFLTSPLIEQAITRFEPQSGILSEIRMFRHSSTNSLGLDDCVQFLVESTSLEKVDECELANHQSDNSQENSTASIVKANNAAKAVESE
jgi:hypothetical protein